MRHVLERQHEGLTEKVIGMFYRVYNSLGYGFAESVYSRALELELVRAGLHVVSEAPVEVRYRGEVVGSFRADILVESCLVLELKTSAALAKPDWMQLLNYLRCTDLEVGLLLHFGPRPTVKRLVAANTFPGSVDQRSSRSPSASSA